MTVFRWPRFQWLAAALLLSLAGLLAPQSAQAACAATLDFRAIGDQRSDDFSACSTPLQQSSDNQDNASPRWSGLHTAMGAAVRGPFNCGIGTAPGCRSPSPQTVSTSHATWAVSTNLLTGSVSFELMSRGTTAAFADTLTLYTFIGAADAPVAVSVTNSAYTYTLDVAAEGPTITLAPATLPQASVGTTYQPSLSASGGTAPYTYSHTGGMANGVSLGADGRFSGTPTTAQTVNFTVTAQDANGAQGSQPYTLTVVLPAPTAQDDIASVAANSSTNVITPRLGGGAATALVIDTMPQHGTASVVGMTLRYTPTPGYSGTDSVRYTASNATGGASATVGITVTAPTLGLTPAAGALPGATVGASYNQTITASGGGGSYTYSVASGTLPSGVTLNPSTGALTGAPLAAGNASFAIGAVDNHGATGQAHYTLAVAHALPIAQDVSTTVDANSPGTSIAPNLSGGAAASLTIAAAASHGTASVNGLQLVYTPTAGYSGPDTFRYYASNGTGRSGEATVTVTVRPPTFAFTPAAGDLPGGAAGAAYTGATVQASGGTAPYRYAVTTGSLPTGLSLDPDTGAITGTPTAQTSASFTVTATDAHNATGSVAYRLAVGMQVPSVANVDVTVPANSSSNAVVLQLGGGTAASVAVATPPSHGTASASGTTITYTPQPGYSGTDSFGYTATNAGGTSAQATVTITVSSPTLSFTPAPGALPGGTVAAAYGQTFTVAGGTAPYRYALTGSLPAGLSLSGGTVSGTPTAAATARFSIEATDANGATASAAYTLTVQGAAPVAPSRTVQLLAGTSLSVDLTDGATGGPFTDAAIVTPPPAQSGTARISGQWQMTFSSAPAATGDVVVRYTLSNAWQTSAPGTITFTVLARPDPSKDPEVIGLLNAEARAAERFATTQISNFGSRLERLHDERARHGNGFGLRLSGGESTRARGRPPAGATLGRNAAPGLQAAASPETPAGRDDGESAAGGLAFWTGGFVNFGSSDTDGAGIDHTLVGVSTGVDYRFSADFVAGVGVGYGRDVSDVGSRGTRSTGKALSAALYGSYHPGPYFVDALLGAGTLDFDSRRYVTATGGRAEGSRDGRQVFGSLSSGYEHRDGGLLISPYGRLQAAWTRLDGYTEQGAGVYSLAYGEQSLSMLSGVAGLRGEYAVPMRWGTLATRGRVEYIHDFAGSSWVTMGYADLGNQPYRLNVQGLSRNTMALELGLQGVLDRGMSVGLSYRASLGFTDQMRDSSVALRFMHRF